jgi:c-di-AMP phosphodiesterase-like protein
MNGYRFWQKEQLYWIAFWVGLVASFALNPSWITFVLLVLLMVASYLRYSCSGLRVPQSDVLPIECAGRPAGEGQLAGSPSELDPEATAAAVAHGKALGETVFAFIQIDNLEDVLQGMDENQRNALQTETHQHLLNWCGHLNGFLRKYSEDMYMGIFSRQELDRMIAEKFDILDEVRALRVGNKLPVTISMGVAASGVTMSERGQKAQTGLDLALGRGGDQAAVYVNGEVQFYGGKAKVMEKNTRVKARVVAHAIRELMLEATDVMIMGHEGEDFDSLGSAMGVARMAAHLGKRVNIVVGEIALSFEKLQELLPDYTEYEGLFLTVGEALERVTPSTLLFVVDTHRVFLTAAPQLIDIVDRRVVIDHHRRSEDFIPNPMIVYLEPSASSTSELVTELLTYFDEKIELTRLEASALFSGMVVDTKNFAVQTGVRTFEAAAYLRRSGADPAIVRHLFMVDMETLKLRAAILAGSQSLAGGVVIASCPSEVKNGQIISAQAADTMLSIEGVRVSFVLCPADGGVGISARSNGDVNVQVIMEAFGGGGHQTVAGAHIDGVDLTEARKRLEAVIADYIGEEKE